LQKRDRIPGLGDDDSDEEAEEGDSYRIGLLMFHSCLQYCPFKIIGVSLQMIYKVFY